MNKDPAFLFYPGDWLGGTMTFNRSHKGAYMDLLMAQFNNGHMEPQDIKTVLGIDFDEMWEKKLKSKFVKDGDGKYYNSKLENEVLKRKKFTESRRKNLLGEKSHMDNHMSSHMENENENVNKDIKRKKQIFKKPTPQEVTEYARSIGSDLDGEHFCDSNEAKGWVIGKNHTPMKDWKATVRTWKVNAGKEQPIPERNIFEMGK